MTRVHDEALCGVGCPNIWKSIGLDDSRSVNDNWMCASAQLWRLKYRRTRMVRARDMRSRYRHWDIYVGSRRLIVYCELPAEISRGHHSSDSHITSFKNRFCLREKGYQSHEPSVISPARLPCLRDESHRSGAAAVKPTACKPDPRNNSLLSGQKEQLVP